MRKEQALLTHDQFERELNYDAALSIGQRMLAARADLSCGICPNRCNSAGEILAHLGRIVSFCCLIVCPIRGNMVSKGGTNPWKRSSDR